MKIGLHIFSLILTLALAAQIAVAEPGGKKGKGKLGTPGVDRRLERQKARIAKKLEKGNITQQEADALNSKVNAIEANKQAAAEGGVTLEERKALQSQLDATKAEIRNTGKAPKAPKSGEPSSETAQPAN